MGKAMANAELAMRIAASADKVWATFAGPEMVQLLLECYAAKVEVETDERAGVATFVTTLRSGGVVRERMESLDHAERCMKYRVLDAGPLPYANYRGEARVQPCGTDACVVSFQCSFIPVDASEHDARQYWLDHNHKVLETLRQLVEGRRSV
jgi:hypothetical protein